jgi:hypothetical protein
MHCGPSCGGGGSRGAGGGGSGGGMGGSGGGMGGSGGGMGGGLGGSNRVMAAPQANCADHRRKPDRHHRWPNVKEADSELSQCPYSR